MWYFIIITQLLILRSCGKNLFINQMLADYISERPPHLTYTLVNSVTNHNLTNTMSVHKLKYMECCSIYVELINPTWLGGQYDPPPQTDIVSTICWATFSTADLLVVILRIIESYSF